MAKKKNKFSHFLKKKAKRNPESAPSNSGGASALSDNPLVSDSLHFVLPGVGGYAGTKILVKFGGGLVGNMIPSMLQPHVQPIVAALVSVVVWYLTEHVELLNKYRESIVVGSGIATVQTIVQTYMPGLAALCGCGVASGPDPRLAAAMSQGDYDYEDVERRLTSDAHGALPESASINTSVTTLSDDVEDSLRTGIFAPN